MICEKIIRMLLEEGFDLRYGKRAAYFGDSKPYVRWHCSVPYLESEALLSSCLSYLKDYRQDVIYIREIEAFTTVIPKRDEDGEEIEYECGDCEDAATTIHFSFTYFADILKKKDEEE